MSKMISLTNDGAFLASDNITASEFVNMTMNAQLNLFKALVEQGAPKAELYDLFNEAASAFLSVFAPEIELRPDLTEEAILEAENQLLAKKANKTAHFTPKQQKVEQLKNEHLQATSPNYTKPIEPDLLPLDSLDDAGRPKKPVHTQEV
jgi:hypothetical protein